MSGSGYAIGLAMATYEWIAALGLILVAKFFIPIFLEKKIFTMPQFLEERFDKRVKTVMAVFWLAVFIFINLTSILYLGALTIEKVMGIPMLYGIIGLAAFAGIYSIYGGLKAVALTDVVQGLCSCWRRAGHDLYRPRPPRRRWRRVPGNGQPLWRGER